MADTTTEPAESTSQELRGVADTGGESFAVDGINEIAEETKENETPAEGVEPEEKSKEETTPDLEKGGEEEAGKEKAEEEKVGEKKEQKEEDLPAGIKKRLATITRKRYDAERAAEAARAENAALIARLEALEHPEAKEAKGEPQIDDFETEEEYLEAVSDWKADQKIAERDAALRAEQEKEIMARQKAEAQARQEALITNLQKGVEKYKDFEDVIEDLNITGDMIQILESLPNIPDVVYELGKNPETVADLIEMPFFSAAYRMKEISDGLIKKKMTKAPDPIKPVKTTGGLIKSLEKMNMKEYIAYRDKQDKEKRGLTG